QKVIPREVLWNGIADQISDFALARFLVALRHFLATAALVIARIEAGPRVGLKEILRIGAADREFDFVDVPVVRGVECEDHVVTDLAPLLWRFLFRPHPPLPGLIENLRTAIRDLNLLTRFPPETPNVESRVIRLHYFVSRAGQFEKCVQAIFDRIYCSVFPDDSRFVCEQQRRILVTQDLWRGQRCHFAYVVSGLVPFAPGGHKARKLGRLRRIVVVELTERQRVYLFNRRPAEILEERIANEIAQFVQRLIFDNAAAGGRHRIDRSSLPDFEIRLKAAVFVDWDHFSMEIDPDSILGRVSLLPVKSDEQPIVLVGGFDQRNARLRILRDTRIDDRVVDHYGE